MALADHLHAPEPSAVISVKLPLRQKQALQVLAHKHITTTSHLIRAMIDDVLQAELPNVTPELEPVGRSPS